MEPMQQQFAQVARKINYSLPQIALVSNLTGELICKEAYPEEGGIASPDYWVRHVREPVRFADGIATLQQQNVKVFLEIGPKPILSGLVQHCFDFLDHNDLANHPLILPSLRPNQPNWQTLLESLGQLYALGVKVDWAGFDRDYSRQQVRLPTYAWKRQRYWIEKQTTQVLETTKVRPSTAIREHLEQGNVQQIVNLLAAKDALSAVAREAVGRCCFYTAFRRRM